MDHTEDVHDETTTSPLVQDKASVPNDMISLVITYLHDGFHGRMTNYCTDPQSLYFYRLYHKRWWRYVVIAFSIIHCLLVLVEIPGSKVQSGHWFLFPLFTSLCEIPCLIVYFIDIYIVFKHHGWKTWTHHRWTVLRVVVVLMMCIDLIISFAYFFSVIRFSRGLRPLIIIARLRNLRKLFTATLYAIPNILSIVLLLFTNITFFSFLGFLLFCETNDKYFTTFPVAWYNMLKTQISLPHNLVIFNVLSESNHAIEISFMFVSFIIVGHFFLFKLIIAVSYRSFKNFTHKARLKKIDKREKAWNKAFELISKDGSVTYSTWHDVFHEYRTVYSPPASERLTQALFNVTLDNSEVKFPISKEKFISLLPFLPAKLKIQKQFTKWPRYKMFRKYMRRILSYELDLGFLQLEYAEIPVYSLIILSSVQLAICAKDSTRTLAWQQLGVVILCLFWLEMIVKLVALGYSRFWNNGFRRMDVLCNMVSMIYYLSNGLVAKRNDERYSYAWSAALIFRLLRILKILSLIGTVKKVLWTLEKIYPMLIRLFFVFFSLLYFFTELGVQFYCGQLTKTNPLLINNPKAKGWLRFADQLNYDSFHSGIMTTFQVIILSKWPIVMDAAVIVSNKGSYFFFFFIRIITDMIYFPIFIGFMIESFVTHFDIYEEKMKKKQPLIKSRSFPATTHKFNEFCFESDKELCNIQVPRRISAFSEWVVSNSAVQAATTDDLNICVEICDFGESSRTPAYQKGSSATTERALKSLSMTPKSAINSAMPSSFPYNSADLNESKLFSNSDHILSDDLEH